ncbi:MAG: GNAT family N-acetyltransferase [Pseudomonadota bacterium]
MAQQRLNVRFQAAMSDIRADDWDALVAPDLPHLSHSFLDAAETSGSVSADTGWLPCHVTVERDDALVAVMPLYQKAHSWGEFVFDWGWADAYRRAGLEYYPKLVSATPFTPATANKLCVAPGEDATAIREAMLAAVLSFAQEQSFPSLHLQFIADDERAPCEAAGMILRQDCQFHWHNEGYTDFDHFLAAFTSKKRKNARRERRRVTEAGIRHVVIPATEISEAELADAWRLCSYTFAARGHTPYLNLEFFQTLRETKPAALEVVLARHGERNVAAAILLRGKDSLYGRYWGSDRDYHSLHFETCYYQGIEHCINEGITRFEPGTQGEHKVARGFLPVRTASAHWLAHPQFAAAIGDYIEREAAGVDQYMRYIDDHSPFRAIDTGDAS